MIDPWESTDFDYEKVIEQFGIKPFQDLITELDNPHKLMRRGVVFGHRDFKIIIDAITNNKKFTVLTGMMPSGKMHIGHKMIVDQIVWYQENGANIRIPIADLEAYSARGISFSESKKLAVYEYITNYIALGVDFEKENVTTYLQSKENIVKDLAFILSKKVNFNEMKAIYGFGGSTNMAHMQAPIVQVSDILHTQLNEFGGPKPVIVPVGIDQDPHIRLTRDLAYKFKSQYGFVSPSSTYHRFMTGLTGGKMSSSKPKSAIFLSDSPEIAEQKVKTTKTGGRESLKEQKELGGNPNNCVIYELFLYHLIDSDTELMEIYNECKEGTCLCGHCKAKANELTIKFFEEFNDKREEASEIAKNMLFKG